MVHQTLWVVKIKNWPFGVIDGLWQFICFLIKHSNIFNKKLSLNCCSDFWHEKLSLDLVLVKINIIIIGFVLKLVKLVCLKCLFDNMQIQNPSDLFRTSSGPSLTSTINCLDKYERFFMTWHPKFVGYYWPVLDDKLQHITIIFL